AVAGAEKSDRRSLQYRLGGEDRDAVGAVGTFGPRHDQGRARPRLHRADRRAGGGADQGGVGRRREESRRRSRRHLRGVRGGAEEARRGLLTTVDSAYSRRRGDRFIQTIEWLAAIFVA